MRYGMRVLALSTLALVLVAQETNHTVFNTSSSSAACHKNENKDGDIYKCSGQVVTVTTKTTKIECRDKILNCSKLPYQTTSQTKLSELLIERCILNSSLECVLKALGATGTKKLKLRGQNTSLTEEAVLGLHMVEFLVFEDGVPGAQTTIPIPALKQLQDLIALRLDNIGHLTILPNAFNQAEIPKLIELNIVKNNMTTLPADAFNGLEELYLLSIYNNSIEAIDNNTFKGLSSLNTLALDENSFSSLPTEMLVHTPKLKNLTVTGNHRELRLHAWALSGSAHLTKVSLQSVKLTLDPRSLYNFTSKSVELEDSNITELPEDLFQDTTVTRLTLKNNSLMFLPQTVFKGLEGLKELDLSKNKLITITKETFLPLANITKIDFQENHIRVLTERLFYTLPALHILSFARNNISLVHKRAFQGSQVRILDLSHNKLNWQCGLKSPLAHLNAVLEKLNLSYNNIQGICHDWSQMYYLLELDLSYNRISNLTIENSNFITKHLTVDLRHNNITTLNSFLNASASFLVGRNPFHCDCRLYKILKNQNKFHFDLKDAECASPEPMRYQDLNATSLLANLTCPVNAPQNCTCIVRPAKNQMECDCYGLEYKTLPDPTTNVPKVTEMVLTLRKMQSLLGIPSFVKSLSLSSLGLETVPDIPETITHLDLRHNKLSRVPLEILQRNITLELIGNQLICDCLSKEDVQNIQSNQNNIIDYESLFCTDGGLLQSVHTAQLCEAWVGTIIGASLTVFGVFLAIVIVLLYEHSRPVKELLEKLGIISKRFTYCIFLSYSHKDEQFVKQQLLPKLDEDFDVCEHTRDWIVGDSIIEQIYRSVRESRKTLIVLSNAYLDPDGWASTEFRAAIYQSEKDNLSRIIIILLEEVNRDCAPEHIKRHLEGNTYIKWENTKSFWDKLYAALPTKKSEAEKEIMLKERANEMKL